MQHQSLPAKATSAHRGINSNPIYGSYNHPREDILHVFFHYSSASSFLTELVYAYRGNLTITSSSLLLTGLTLRSTSLTPPLTTLFLSQLPYHIVFGTYGKAGTIIFSIIFMVGLVLGMHILMLWSSFTYPTTTLIPRASLFFVLPPSKNLLPA